MCLFLCVGVQISEEALSYVKQSQSKSCCQQERMLAFTLPSSSFTSKLFLSLASLREKGVMGMRSLFENMALSLEPAQHFLFHEAD